MSVATTYTLGEIEDRTGFERRTVAYYVQQGLLPKVGRRGAKTRYPQLFMDRLMFIRMIREQQDQGLIGNLTLAEIRDILDRTPVETISDVAAGREPLEATDVRVDPDISAPRTEAPPAKFRDEPSDVVEVDLSFVDGAVAAPVEQPEPEAGGQEPEPEPAPRLRGLSDTRTLREINGLKNGSAPRSEEDAEADVDAAIDEDDTDSDGRNGYPLYDEIDRLGWSLARLQRALTDAPRHNRGTTESWHRARITPELTISARNLPDKDAQLLDGVSRVLKKLLWKAWEE